MASLSVQSACGSMPLQFRMRPSAARVFPPSYLSTSLSLSATRSITLPAGVKLPPLSDHSELLTLLAHVFQRIKILVLCLCEAIQAAGSHEAMRKSNGVESQPKKWPFVHSQRMLRPSLAPYFSIGHSLNYATGRSETVTSI